MSLRMLLKDTAYKALTSLKGDAEGFVRLPVLRGPAKGLQFEFDLVRRHEGAYFMGKYDPELLKTLRSVVRPGWTIWDVGTYLGFYSVFFNQLVGPTGKVACIEPDPRKLERTRRNLKLNGFQNCYHLPVAIGAPLGEVEFLLSDESNSHLPGTYVGERHLKKIWQERDARKKSIRIPCISLDQAYFERHLPAPNLVKLDIEGAELHALKHGDRLFREVRPLLLLELHNPDCDAEAWAFSQRLGYVLQRADDRQVLRRAEDVRGTLLCLPQQ